MGFSQIIGYFFGAVKEFFGFANKKTELNNTPEMKQRKEAQTQVKEDDEFDKTIKDGDVDDTRNNLSE